MANELVHGSVGTTMTQSEFEAIGLHVCNSQASGDLIYASSATQLTRLGKGTDGDFLSSGTPPTWVTHATDLDAHTRNMAETVKTGSYYQAGLPIKSFTTHTPPGAGRIYGQPFWVARTTTYDRIAIEVTTLEAGKNVRLGIYNDGTNIYPGTLLLDAGTVSTASTGIKTITINQQLTKGLYWLAALTESTTMAFRAASFAWSPLGLVSTNFSTMETTYRAAETYGALPTPFTASAGGVDNQILIVLRPLSLD